MNPRAGARGRGERMDIMEAKRLLKKAVIEAFGDIPKAYPLTVVYTFSLDKEIKNAIDTSTPILAEDIIYYMNFDDPFARVDEDEVIISVRVDGETVIDCTPANFLQPECISAYYRRSSARATFDYSPIV